MDLKDQCCSFEQAKEFHGLGLKTGANFYFSHDGTFMTREAAKDIMSRPFFKEKPTPFYPAYTSSELGAMLPPYTGIKFMEAYNVWKVDLTINSVDIYETAKTEAGVRAAMLIRLISNAKYSVTVDEVKERLISVSKI